MTEVDFIYRERILAFHKLHMQRGMRRYEMMGILTCLWDLARELGDNGYLCITDEELGDRMDWENDPKSLIADLVASGWLVEGENCPFYRVRWFGLSETWFGAIDPEKLEGRT